MIAEEKDGKLMIIDVGVDSPAEKARINIGNRNQILGVEIRAPQPDRYWFTLPGILLLAFVVWSQRRRLTAQPA